MAAILPLDRLAKRQFHIAWVIDCTSSKRQAHRELNNAGATAYDTSRRADRRSHSTPPGGSDFAEFALPSLATGLEKLVWLKMLKKSARNCKPTRSASGKFLAPAKIEIHQVRPVVLVAS
jgi:hypothetical protein